MRATLNVNLGSSSYSVSIANRIKDDVEFRGAEFGECDQAFIISDNTVSGLYRETLQPIIESQFTKITWVDLSPGENSKTINTITSLYQQGSIDQLNKECVVIAIGGGVIQDIATYFAATFLRGIPLMQIPTTVLAQADLAFGGCAINAFGTKSLLGTFYQPRKVHLIHEFLETLPPFFIACGLAEILNKVLCLAGLRSQSIATELKEAATGNSQVLADLILESLKVKLRIIESDETGNLGTRSIPEWGHTVGHSLEQAKHFSINHGAALTFGMAVEAKLSHRIGELSSSDLETILGAIDAIGIPPEQPSEIEMCQVARTSCLRKVRLLTCLGQMSRPIRIDAETLMSCML